MGVVAGITINVIGFRNGAHQAKQTKDDRDGGLDGFRSVHGNVAVMLQTDVPRSITIGEDGSRRRALGMNPKTEIQTTKPTKSHERKRGCGFFSPKRKRNRR
jgi:hypothetical protein